MTVKLIGISENILRIEEVINQVANTGLNVVVCGETGVGKEVVVQSLYLKSNRSNKPFVKVNCAALPDTLLESEMFGYEKGAFTGADRRKKGKFEQAHGGVLFLDEIGDMSLPLQAKLLHVLQGGDFTPLGSEKSVKANTWVVTATNHNLEQDLKTGKFREDLYYRLSTIKIFIEPLRNRTEDISYLIDYYVKEYANQLNVKKLSYPSPKTIDKLCSHHWPGNVRELQNVLKRIMILGESEESIDAMLNGQISQTQSLGLQSPETEAPISFDLWGGNGENSLGIESFSLKKITKKAVARVEKEVISYVLDKTGWNRSKAAKILKISYKTLLYKITDLDINPDSDSDNQLFSS
jgi:transcriptional regulator with PAS, ATPase and Fis domain